MSDQPLRRILFSSPETQERSHAMKTIVKPKEEVRSVTPVSARTSERKKRSLPSSFTSTSLRDICESSPVPLPVAAAAAAAAAAKHSNDADSKTTMEEMVKAAGLVLHSHSFGESEEQKDTSTPVRRKSVTFAEPIQVTESKHSLSSQDPIDRQMTERKEQNDEDDSKAIENMSTSDADGNVGENRFQRSQLSPIRRFVHRLGAPKNQWRTENSKAGFQHIASPSTISNGREMELERMPLLNKNKICLERSSVECNEQIKSQRDAFKSGEKVRTKHTTLTNGQQHRGNGAFDSLPLEEESKSHSRTPSSDNGLSWKPNRTQSKLELEFSNSCGTQAKSNEVAQFAFEEESGKSSLTTESFTNELKSTQRASTRSHRKPRLSEVLKLQKSLETAFWTDSRMIRKQTQAIVISDDESPTTPRGKNSATPKKELEVSVSRERDKTRSNKKSGTMLPSSVKKNVKTGGIVKPSRHASVIQRGMTGSPSIASRTRSKSAKAITWGPKKQVEKAPQRFRSRPKTKKGANEISVQTTEEVQKETGNADVEVEKHEEPTAVRTPRSSKRKSRVPQHLPDQDIAERSEKLASDEHGRRKVSKTSTTASPRNSKGRTLSLNDDEEDFDSMAENSRDPTPVSRRDPLQDLKKVKLNNRMWQNVREGWEVHNDITACAGLGLNSSTVSVYVESPFGCENLVSAFASDFGLEDKE